MKICIPQGVEYRCLSVQKVEGLAAEPLLQQEHHQLCAPGRPEVKKHKTSLSTIVHTENNDTEN